MSAITGKFLSDINDTLDVVYDAVAESVSCARHEDCVATTGAFTILDVGGDSKHGRYYLNSVDGLEVGMKVQVLLRIDQGTEEYDVITASRWAEITDITNTTDIQAIDISSKTPLYDESLVFAPLVTGESYFYNGRDTGVNTLIVYGYLSLTGMNRELNYGTVALGVRSRAFLPGAMAIGKNVVAYGLNAHAEGAQTIATGYASHAEGVDTVAEGTRAHSEGNGTTASGDHSHAEGSSTTASAFASHAEGSETQASFSAAHAEGANTTASGVAAHAEGAQTIATGYDTKRVPGMLLHLRFCQRSPRGDLYCWYRDTRDRRRRRDDL